MPEDLDTKTEKLQALKAQLEFRNKAFAMSRLVVTRIILCKR